MKWFIALSLLLTVISSHADTTIYEKQYDGFTLWLDCNKHGAIAFKYELGKDEGNIKRSGHSFKIDKTIPASCQPSSTATFRNETVDIDRTGTYDIGHLVPANHMENSLQSYKDSFYMSNVLPQQTKFNRNGGAWFYTEVISECFRDVTPLTIWGGVIWGDDKSDDFFVGSHDVTTPDYWWKLIKRHDSGDFIAWLFPNKKTTKKRNIDEFIVSIEELVSRIKFIPDFGIENSRHSYKPDKSWKVSGSRQLKCEGITTSSG